MTFTDKMMSAAAKYLHFPPVLAIAVEKPVKSPRLKNEEIVGAAKFKRRQTMMLDGLRDALHRSTRGR